jgi:DNA-binding Lrp family transcriptional regulator
MELNERDRRLIAAIQDGLPLAPRPYAAIGEKIGIGEAEVIAGLRRLIDDGVIKRFGVIVRHRELGYRANAMVVWDVPDGEAGDAGQRLATDPAVTLCYRRERALPEWPYNLYCMVHGRERASVTQAIERLCTQHGLDRYPRHVLFSKRCFSQRAARYG